MARAIGRTKSWIWWVSGFLCALAFGGLARAGELVRRVAKYGVRARPVRPAVNAEQKKQAEKLVEEYLKPVEATEPGAEAKKAIEGLIRDFGSGDFKKRQAASEAVVKHGAAALGALREAAASKDAEVAQRARLAVSTIENTGRRSAVGGLRKMGSAGWSFVGQRLSAARKAAAIASKALAEARKSGDAAALKKAEAAYQASRARVGVLNRLYNTLRPQPSARVYGIRVRPE